MKHTPSDHALALIKAGLNLVPLVGGSLASLVGDYIPTSTQRSIEKATEFLRADLTRLQGRIDADMVDKDEFADLFKSCYLIVVRTTREEKLRGAAAILANILLKPGDPAKVSYTELDHLIRSLDALSSGAIMVLGAAREVAKTTQPDQWGTSRLVFSDLQRCLNNMDPWLLMGLVGELSTVNLLRVETVPSITFPHYGNYQLQLTPLGKRFMDQFIEGNVPSNPKGS